MTEKLYLKKVKSMSMMPVQGYQWINQSRYLSHGKDVVSRGFVFFYFGAMTSSVSKFIE